MNRYEFDRELVEFKKVSTSLGRTLKTVLKYLVGTLSLSFLYYILFCSFINTDKERRLRKENRLYKETYAQMVERQAMVGDVIKGLELKDEDIYGEIFHTTAPSLFSLGGTDFLAQSDTIQDKDIVAYTQKKVSALETSAARIERNFRAITSLLGYDQVSVPPMNLPLEDLSYVQTGASIGNKLNPYYKVEMYHNGLDLVAPQGDPVLATADGVVTSVTTSRKGLGNVVEITHAGGYVTRYAHLSDIVVRKGQTVQKGKKIASVGISGNSYIPHLHYEVLKDGLNQDPCNYLFASVSPDEYAEILYMASSTGQSMD